MELKERLEIFKEELDLIVRKDVRDFVKVVIAAAPDYIFEDCPSSSSGRYHPVDELGGSGNIIHSKKVFTVVYELCRALNCEDKRDELLAGSLLHDMMKQGELKSGHTVKHHPRLAAELVAKVYNVEFKDKLDKMSANLIYQIIFHHYGLWTEEESRKPLKDYSILELCVYLSDYIASKRCIKVDYIRKDGLGFAALEKNL